MLSFRLIKAYVIPIAVTLCIHGLLIALLLNNWEFKTEKNISVKPKFIEAKLVELKQKSKPAEVKKSSKIIDLTLQKKQEEQKAREAENKKKAEIKKKELELKRIKDKEKAEEKAKQEKLLAQQRERQKKLEEQVDQQKKAEEEKKRLEKEKQQLEEAYATEAQSYSAIIRSRIEQNWNKPPSARKDMKCVLRINLVPTGRVISVTVLTSSGNDAFDRSALQAVKQVEVFSEIKNMSIGLFESQFRQFTLTFSPEDSRL